jgi:hypothetical protein
MEIKLGEKIEALEGSLLLYHKSDMTLHVIEFEPLQWELGD